LELQYHFVWKTKYGYPILRGDIGLRVRELIRKICVEKAITVVRGNVRADHIHVLVSAPSHLSVSKIAQFLKGKSSYRLQREFPELKKRYWASSILKCNSFGAIIGTETRDDSERNCHVKIQASEP